MSDLFTYPPGATPLTADEADGLIPTHVTLRRELNELERDNILAAQVWAAGRRHDPVDEAFARGLHRRMFGDVWRWAGAYRTSDKNIGVAHALIQPALYEVLDNVRFWIDQSAFAADEIAAQFHHGLVKVHPFANGNGRWSRMMADILLRRLGQPPFTWGRSRLDADDETRRAYIAALRSADRWDFSGLYGFVRSWGAGAVGGKDRLDNLWEKHHKLTVTETPIDWVASSEKDLLACPEDVIDAVGYALHVAQQGASEARGSGLQCSERQGMSKEIPMADSDNKIIRGTGDVFADLGYSDPAEHRTKAGLVDQIRSVLRARGLTQAEAAKLTEIAQADLSRLLSGKFRNVSVDRLMRALTRLDMEVVITVSRRGAKTGETIQYA